MSRGHKEGCASLALCTRCLQMVGPWSMAGLVRKVWVGTRVTELEYHSGFYLSSHQRIGSGGTGVLNHAASF